MTDTIVTVNHIVAGVNNFSCLCNWDIGGDFEQFIARCIIGVLQYTSNLRGNVLKYDSICSIDSKISLRYFIINVLAINQFSSFIKFLPEIGVANGCIFCDIYLMAEEVFKRILEIEKVIGIIKQAYLAFVKIYTKIYIALWSETTCKDRTEYP